MVAAEVYQAIFAAFRTRKMSELAKAASDVLGMPVVVTDAAFIVRAKYPDVALGDEQWDANRVNRQIEPRFVKTFTDDDHFLRHDEAGKAILTDWGHYETAPRLTSVLRAGGVVLGYFAALATGVDVEEWHYEAADVIGEAFSLFMDDTIGSVSGRAGFASPTLYALLNSADEGRFDSSAVPAEFVDENRAPHVLFSIRTENPHNAPLEMYFGGELVKHFERAVQAMYQGSLYVLASEVSEDARGSVRAQMFADALARRGLLCGVSRVFSNLSEIGSRRWEADAALRVAFHLELPGSMFHYNDLFAEILCDVLDESIPSIALEDDAMDALKRYDAENGTKYFGTMKAYFQAGFDKKRACEILHIHRNTLQYRLDRICQLADVDVDDLFYALYFTLDDFRQRKDRGSR